MDAPVSQTGLQAAASDGTRPSDYWYEEAPADAVNGRSWDDYCDCKRCCPPPDVLAWYWDLKDLEKQGLKEQAEYRCEKATEQSEQKERRKLQIARRNERRQRRS